MMAPHAGLERRVLAALDASPARIPVVIGGCGTGRTTLLHALARSPGPRPVPVRRRRARRQHARALPAGAGGHLPVHHQRPERLGAAGYRALRARSRSTARWRLLSRARVAGDRPATFLLDEALELRTFESFPGLRHVLRETLQAIADSGNRFVLTSRYVTRALRLLRDGSPRFEVIHLPALTAAEATAMLPPMGETPVEDRDFLGRTDPVAGRRPRRVRARARRRHLGDQRPRRRSDQRAHRACSPSEGALSNWCAHRYELRLHKARGYGALKAILEILADEEPLTLTEVAQRLHRTPGSTKDYLSWLEDVDLIVSRQKRYSFADPVMRLWVRLHCRPVPPSVDEVAREVQAYAMARLPHAEPSMAMATAGSGERKDWGIIEID